VRATGDRPVLPLHSVAPETLCVTSGELTSNVVAAPTFRAVATGHRGDAASLTFRIEGATKEQRTLESGELRQQLGLKLRAADPCNLVYVMWRFAPRPRVEVSVKTNPGAATSKECGASGYENIKPRARIVPRVAAPGSAHELRAEIVGDALTAWIDGAVAWQGALPATARDLAGPAGVRSDNVNFEVVEVRVDERAAQSQACSESQRRRAGE